MDQDLSIICEFSGDIENNCEGCAYSSDYFFKDGVCVRRVNDEN